MSKNKGNKANSKQPVNVDHDCESPYSSAPLVEISVQQTLWETACASDHSTTQIQPLLMRE